MQVRSAVELIFNFAWWKTFVSNDDTFIDIVVSYECRVSTGINTDNMKRPPRKNVKTWIYRVNCRCL